MKKIFIPEPLDTTILIPPDITHHLLHVFRHNSKDPVIVTGSDRRSGSYRITDIMDGRAHAVLDSYLTVQQTDNRIILVQSLLKGDKSEWVLQKATELNVDTIYLVHTANNVVKYDKGKLEQKYVRWQKIVQESAQQCGRPLLPALVVGESLESIFSVESDALKLVAYENENKCTLKKALQEISQHKSVSHDILICIGPEGGFQESEINYLTERGTRPVSLGHTVLRAETAAVAAIAMIQYELEL